MGIFQKIGKNVAFQVVDADEGDMETGGHGLGHAKPDQKGTHQAGAAAGQSG